MELFKLQAVRLAVGLPLHRAAPLTDPGFPRPVSLLTIFVSNGSATPGEYPGLQSLDETKDEDLSPNKVRVKSVGHSF
jgi:hypothetical protein